MLNIKEFIITVATVGSTACFGNTYTCDKCERWKVTWHCQLSQDLRHYTGSLSAFAGECYMTNYILINMCTSMLYALFVSL